MIEDKTIKILQGKINTRITAAGRTNSPSLRHMLKNTGMRSGKRVRGIFVLLTARANNKKITPRILDVAAAVELLHQATLIHDDIVDNSEKRRGISTLNKTLGYEISVLAGDYFFSTVMNMILKMNDPKIISVFAGAVKDVCEGEIEEVYNKFNTRMTREKYFEIIRKKTASLISSSIEAGARCGGFSPADIRKLKAFGENIGMAFQIKDDILDVEGSSKKLGKTAGTDIKEGKITLPFILALETAPEKEARRIKGFVKKGIYPDRAYRFIRKYKGAEKAGKTAEKYVLKAKKYLALTGIRPGRDKILLELMADYMVKRNH
ncbi:MAG: polyprenyl synthetase family protein [Candidatus Goldiibacteriota bacterium]